MFTERQSEVRTKQQGVVNAQITVFGALDNRAPFFDKLSWYNVVRSIDQAIAQCGPLFIAVQIGQQVFLPLHLTLLVLLLFVYSLRHNDRLKL